MPMQKEDVSCVIFKPHLLQCIIHADMHAHWPGFKVATIALILMAGSILLFLDNGLDGVAAGSL